jgi:hypothetical protein
LDDEAQLKMVMQLSAEEFEKEQERIRIIGISETNNNNNNNNNEVPVIFPIKKLPSSSQTNINQLMLDGHCDNFNSDDENANENNENDGFILKQGNRPKNQDIRKFGVNKNIKLATNQYSITEKYKQLRKYDKSLRSPPEKTDNPCHDESSTVVTERVNKEY